MKNETRGCPMTREQILASTTIQSEAVDVPKWGGTVYLKTLNSAQRVEFFGLVEPIKDNPTKVGMLLVVHCLFDDQGHRILQPEDADSLLENQSGELMNRLCAIANRLNGIGDGAAEKAEKK
jgi:hypothetical protein